ncbi:MAG TPA: hypothetical protein VEB21_18850, partial [Terriglobales bacterium]|nr:hypothetical protein [Terriglobales bacterium]
KGAAPQARGFLGVGTAPQQRTCRRFDPTHLPPLRPNAPAAASTQRTCRRFDPTHLPPSTDGSYTGAPQGWPNV